MIARRGVGDWFDPSCTPGTPGCVPHWYCYIPGMATPDCWASFVQGTQELGQAVGAGVAAPVTAAVGGVFTGLLNPNAGQCGSTDFWCNYGSMVLIGAVGIFALVAFTGGGRRRRR